MKRAGALLALLLVGVPAAAGGSDPMAAEKALILAELQPPKLEAWFFPRIQATEDQREKLSPIFERESRILTGLFQKYEDDWVQCIWDIEGEYLERQKTVRAEMKAEATLGPAQMNALYPARLEFVKGLKQKIVDLQFERMKARVKPTAEQVDKLKPILLADLRRKQAYLEANPPTSAAAGWKTYRQIKAFEEETRAQVETVLEKPQYKEFVKFRDEQRKRVKKALGI